MNTIIISYTNDDRLVNLFHATIVNDINSINFKDVNIIINTTNDITITHQLNEFCFKYNIALFDFSIDKNKLQTHIVIPFITTTSYLESLYKEKSFPLCVINHYPLSQDHVIEWAKEQVCKLTCVINPIQYAYDLFQYYYNVSIIKLLESTDENVWNNKLKPSKITFDYNNEKHINFIYETIKLFDTSITHKYIKEQCELLVLLDKKPYSDPKFIKDVDMNIKHIHIDWIKCASDLRCANYGCNEPTINNIIYNCNLHEPSNELINKAYDLLSIELSKYKEKTNNYCNTFIDLDNNILITETPKKANMIVMNDTEFNEWTKLSYNFNTTICEFKKYYETMFDVTIVMIANGGAIIYADFMEDNLNKTLDELNLNKTLLTLMPDNDVIIPEIEITF
jgi:molybdopterin/thiamine biosynthesis adenylyltransferase